MARSSISPRGKAALLLVALAAALFACSAHAQQASTSSLPQQSKTFSVHVSTPLPCSQLSQKVTSALASRLRISLISPGYFPRISSLSVTCVGCRDTVTGYATTYSVTASSSRSSQLANYMAAVVPNVNDLQCAVMLVFCKYSSEKKMPVLAMRAEGVAPPSSISTTVPIGWQAKYRKMMLPVTMGSQQQKMSVVLDTGSTVPYATGFNYLQSTTFTNTSVPGTLEYGGSGNKTGFYCTDTATVGSITAQNFKLLVTDDDKGINGDNGGLFGFALGSYALPGGQANNMTSTWRQLSTAANLEGSVNNRYGLWLSNNSTLLKTNNDFGGELDIGQLNQNRMTGSPVSAPVVPANSSVRVNAQNNTLVWWQFKVARMAILYTDGSSQTICTDCNTIADSGWPEIVITPTDAANIAIGAMKGVAPALGCGYQLLVDLGAAGSVRMNLTRDGLPPVAGCATNYNAGATFTTFPVSGLAPGVTNWYILGLPFLRQFYTVFDFQALQIGFYTSVQA